MKTLLRVLAVSVFLASLGVISGFAQDEICPDLEACFEKYKALRAKDCGSRGEAIKLGKYIGEKYKDDTPNEKLVTAINNNALKIEKEDFKCERNARYDAAWKAKNWDNFLSVSKEIINDGETPKPLALDVMLTLVSAGYDRAAVDKNDKYNNDTIMYSKAVIQNIESGVASSTGKWGVYAPFGTKEDALGWMNYTIGFIMYSRQGETLPDKKKEALPYLYKATQFGEKKTDTSIYVTIGYWYADQATALFKEYTKIREANSNTDTEEAKAKLALSRGFAERALDSFARAHKIAAADKTAKADDVKALFDEVTKFYKFRFNGKSEGQNEFVSGLISKPMPDPTSMVTPVVLEETTTTTTSNSTTTTLPTTTPIVNTPTTTKATPTNGATTTKTTTTATTNKPKTTVKKPVTKKKGTR